MLYNMTFTLLQKCQKRTDLFLQTNSSICDDFLTKPVVIHLAPLHKACHLRNQARGVTKPLYQRCLIEKTGNCTIVIYHMYKTNGQRTVIKRAN